jgi:hypothetical protein
MSGSTLFMRAFTRGLNDELVRSGAITYPTKEASDRAADYVGDRVGIDPTLNPELVTLKVAKDICTDLVKVAAFICEKEGAGSPELAKTASAVTPGQLAATSAFELMQKVAYENETPNTEEEAAKASSGARLDLEARPAGYAVTGVGGGEDKGVGALGSEQAASNRKDRVEGSNSATETSKAAGIAALQKMAKGPENTLSSAAKDDDGAKLEMQRRPPGYAVVGQGNVYKPATGSAIIGAESADTTRKDRVAGSNSVTPLAKSAAERVFDKVAKLVVPYLPESMPDAHKVAHINAMSSLSDSGKARYLGELYGSLKIAADEIEKAVAHFKKTAADADCAEDSEVAEAMEAAADAMQGDKSKSDESEKEAAYARLKAASARIASVA